MSQRIRELEEQIKQVQAMLRSHEKLQNRHVASKPKVDTERRNLSASDDPNHLTPQEIFDILTNNKDAYFEGSYDGDVYLVRPRTETDEELQQRIAAEEERLAGWPRMTFSIAAEITKMHDQIRTLKEQRNDVYKDPDHVEFLRLQAKLKQKGLL